MYHKSIYARELINGNKIILCNIRNGSYIKTNTNYYTCINNIIKNKHKFVDDNLIPCSIKKDNLKKLFDALVDINFYIKYGHVETNNLDTVYLAITNRCNLNCIHCTAKSSVNEIDKLNTIQIYRLIDQFSSLNIKTINITGGEPLIREDCIKILKYLRIHFAGHIVLSTNALLINNENAHEIIKYVDEISISLDGYDENSVNRIRGYGIYGKVINSIKILHDINFSSISLSMLSSKYTEDKDQEFYSLCDKLDVKPLIHRFTPNGRGAENIDYIFTEKIYDESISKNTIRPHLCFPGEREIFINMEGNVFPCGNLSDNSKFIMGNILNMPIKKILYNWHANNFIENFRPWKLEKCKECNVNLFCHSCISNVLNLMNNDKYFNKMCSSMYTKLYKTIWE